jgi:hypothetical protein
MADEDRDLQLQPDGQTHSFFRGKQKENEKKKNLTKRRIFSTTPRIDHGHDDRDEQRSVFVTVLSLWGVLLRVKNDDLSVIKRGDGRECDISARGSRKPTPP